ncbi:reverse transcriptase domain-containing protein [Tanacetum coccineum]
MVTIGKQLPEHFKKELRNLLRANSGHLASHKQHDMHARLHTAAVKEAKELTKARTLRKVKHQTWVANPVMVKKNDGGLRMCVDFTDINKACPKDCYPLPEIDYKIESLAGFHLKCFLDAYKSYHQIQRPEEMKDKNNRLCKGKESCLPGKGHRNLKNISNRIKGLVLTVFSKQIGRNLKAYVDDIVIKSTSEEGILSDIQETFKRKIPPFLQGEALTMYLVASKESINAALFAKRSEEQIPIYLVSKVLQGVELSYPALEKLILALVHVARRLQRYFQAHGNLPPNVDFLPEIPFDDSDKKVKEKEVSDPSNEWKLYTDGASSSDGVGTRLMLIDPAGKEYTYALRFEFETTNNEGEYEALLAGLRIAQEMEITKVAIFLDSQLVVNQIKGTYAAKQLSIKSYLQKVKTALKGFEGYTVGHVRRNQNKKADALSKLASMTFEHLTKEVLVEVLAKRSIEEKEVLKRIRRRLGKSGFKSVQANPREAAKAIQDCDKCKEQSAIRKAGVDGAIAVGSTWPFSHWGIHILGPLPMAPGGLQFLAIAVEHSTKWVEAKPITVKNARQVEKFVWEYVVCRFGVPWMISSKEEKHFKEGIFADFCKGLKITQTFSPITEHMEIMHYTQRLCQNMME